MNNDFVRKQFENLLGASGSMLVATMIGLGMMTFVIVGTLSHIEQTNHQMQQRFVKKTSDQLRQIVQMNFSRASLCQSLISSGQLRIGTNNQIVPSLAAPGAMGLDVSLDLGYPRSGGGSYLLSENQILEDFGLIIHSVKLYCAEAGCRCELIFDPRTGNPVLPNTCFDYGGGRARIHTMLRIAASSMNEEMKMAAVSTSPIDIYFEVNNNTDRTIVGCELQDSIEQTCMKIGGLIVDGACRVPPKNTVCPDPDDYITIDDNSQVICRSATQVCPPGQAVTGIREGQIACAPVGNLWYVGEYEQCRLNAATVPMAPGPTYQGRTVNCVNSVFGGPENNAGVVDADHSILPDENCNLAARPNRQRYCGVHFTEVTSTVSEENSINIRIEMPRVLDQPITVRANLVGIGGVSAADYRLVSDTVVIPIGATFANFTLIAERDAVDPEPDEQVSLALVEVTDPEVDIAKYPPRVALGRIENRTHTVTIRNAVSPPCVGVPAVITWSSGSSPSANCSAPGGGNLPEGTTRTLFDTSSDSTRLTTGSATITCVGGVLSAVTPISCLNDCNVPLPQNWTVGSSSCEDRTGGVLADGGRRNLVDNVGSVQGAATLRCRRGALSVDAGATCASTTRSASCSAKPANTVWNSVSSITQSWNGSAWVPTNTSVYNATASTSACRFVCSSGYSWNGSTCGALAWKVGVTCPVLLPPSYPPYCCIRSNGTWTPATMEDYFLFLDNETSVIYGSVVAVSPTRYSSSTYDGKASACSVAGSTRWCYDCGSYEQGIVSYTCMACR